MNLRALLGVDASAPVAEVRAAWKARTRELHPDKVGGDHDAFVELQSAWEQWKQEGDVVPAAYAAATTKPSSARKRSASSGGTGARSHPQQRAPPQKRSKPQPSAPPKLSRAEQEAILRRHREAQRRAAERRAAKKPVEKKCAKRRHKPVAETYNARVSDEHARKVKVMWRGGAVLSRRALRAALATFGPVLSVRIGARFAVATFARAEAASAAVWAQHDGFECTFCLT
mgnify:CR=1 FL=1